MYAGKRLCFGGSFNPIHYGHLITARHLAATLEFSRICLIPAFVSPLKHEVVGLPSAEDRCQMCRLAVAGESVFEVDDLEIKRGGASYTIDTIRAIKQQGWKEVHWLIGADQLLSLHLWKEPAQLIAESTLVIMQRPGSPIDWATVPAQFAHLQKNVVDAPLVDISATEIRRRVAAGESIDGLTPLPVIEYIHARGLYKRVD